MYVKAEDLQRECIQVIVVVSGFAEFHGRMGCIRGACKVLFFWVLLLRPHASSRQARSIWSRHPTIFSRIKRLVRQIDLNLARDWPQ